VLSRIGFVIALVVSGCGERTASVHRAPSHADDGSKAGASAWRVPDGWRSETIPFPLDFAPALAHTGAEELRFPPGMFEAGAPDYWSYAFVWRTEDAARLDAAALAGELGQYFRGLVAGVAADKKLEVQPEQVVATARAEGDRFVIGAQVFDVFGSGSPVALEGWAQRHDCGDGALWTFVLAPPTTVIRSQLDELAASAHPSFCRGQ
jgi:hypothetical protein